MISQDKKNHSPEVWDRAARLGPALEFEGEIRGKEDFVVQGRVRGGISLPENDILVAEHARVEADIQARDITVKGEVIGNLTASGRVVIEQTGRLTGDLAASTISLEDGAQFKGSVKILGKA
jgi:cytoskeletal protein CcmA (bactofilin family)